MTDVTPAWLGGPRPVDGADPHADDARAQPRAARPRQRERLRRRGGRADAAARASWPRSRSATSPTCTPRPRTFRVGNRRHRARARRGPTGYGYGDYRGELAEFRGAVEAAAPGVAAGRPAASRPRRGRTTRTTCSPSPARGRSASARTPTRCTPATAARTARRSRSRKALLGPSALAPPVARMAQLAAVASAHGSTFRVSEINSANCGGVHGASDALASALWGTDMLFSLADAGVRGVNFHTFTGAFYAPVDFGLHKGHFAGFVHPLFYAMLLFDRATPNGARLLPAGPNPQTALAQDVGDGRPGGHAPRRRDQQEPDEGAPARPQGPGRARPRARCSACAGRRSSPPTASRSAAAATASRPPDGRCAARRRASTRAGATAPSGSTCRPASAALVTIAAGS